MPYQNPNHPSHPNPTAEPESIIATAAPIEHPETEHGHKVPMDPNEIKPKIASDIAYWSKEFKVSPELLHEAIRTHGIHIPTLRAALAKHEVNLT
jgi:Protein of unknown function (DUF3606)